MEQDFGELLMLIENDYRGEKHKSVLHITISIFLSPRIFIL